MDCEFSVIVTDCALAQLDEIYNYICRVIRMPQAARKVHDGIKTAVFSLRSMPLRGALVKREVWQARGVRIIVVGNYDIYYVVNEEQKVVFVIAVAYSRRDLDNVIDGNMVTEDGRFYGHVDGVCDSGRKYGRSK